MQSYGYSEEEAARDFAAAVLEESGTAKVPPRTQPLKYFSAQVTSLLKCRCPANMAHLRQSRPDSGLAFQVNILRIFEVVPFSVGGGTAGHFAATIREESGTAKVPTRPISVLIHPAREANLPLYN